MIIFIVRTQPYNLVNIGIFGKRAGNRAGILSVCEIICKNMNVLQFLQRIHSSYPFLSTLGRRTIVVSIQNFDEKVLYNAVEEIIKDKQTRVWRYESLTGCGTSVRADDHFTDHNN